MHHIKLNGLVQQNSYNKCPNTLRPTVYVLNNILDLNRYTFQDHASACNIPCLTCSFSAWHLTEAVLSCLAFRLSLAVFSLGKCDLEKAWHTAESFHCMKVLFWYSTVERRVFIDGLMKGAVGRWRFTEGGKVCYDIKWLVDVVHTTCVFKEENRASGFSPQAYWLLVISGMCDCALSQ